MDWISLLEAQLQPAGVFKLLNYQPTERQQAFHDAEEYDVLYGGAAGGGKTKALVMEGIRWCVEHPGLRVGAFRRTYGELKESLIAELAVCDFAAAVGGKWNGTEYELRFPNKSVLVFRYAENLQDATRRQGGEYQGMLFDERTLTPPDVVEFLSSRIRAGRANLPVKGIRSGSNPGGAGHGAVKQRFIDATDYGNKVITDETGQTVRFIPSKLDDNPHIDAGYASRLNRLPEAMRKAFRDGSWDVFAGQYFTEWNHARHVVENTIEVAPSWHRIAGIDWGFAAPWAVLWLAIDEDGRAWVYDELYATQVGESAQAKRVLDAEARHGVPVDRYADDAMWTGRGDAKSVADVYAENGCDLIPAKKGERLVGWQRVRSYLAEGPACAHHRAKGWDTCPMLHVLDGAAPNLVRTLPTLPYDTTASRVEDVDTKAEDHAADALRYALIQLAQPTVDGWLEPDTPDEHEGFADGRFDPMATNPDHEPDDETWQEVTGWDF